MSIKIFDKKTGKWIIQATNLAKHTSIIDANGYYEGNNVEDALQEIGKDLDEGNFNKEEIEALREEFDDHVENHPGGGGGSIPTIKSSFNQTAVDGENEFRINIFFNSPNLGEGSCYISIDNIEVKIQAIEQGNNAIIIPPIGDGRHNVSLYVKDRAGLLSNKLSWDISSGGLKVQLTMDTETDYSIDDRILMTFQVNASTDEPIEMHMTINYEDRVIDNINNGYNSYDLTGLGVGVHTITFHLESGEYRTEPQSFNIVVVNSEGLYLSTTFKDNQTFERGTPLNIDYRVSKISFETFQINMYVDGKLFKQANSTVGSYYWILSSLEIGTHTLKIEAIGVEEDTSCIELTVHIIEGDYTFKTVVTNGLVGWWDASERSNNDIDKEVWTDKINGHKGHLHYFNYNSNGWINNELVCDGSSYVDFDLTPFSNNMKYGYTIDILFKTRDIGNANARVLDMCETNTPNKGCYIDTLSATLTSEINTCTANIDENEDIHITFVIDRTNKFGKIYVNAVMCEAFCLSDSGSGTSTIYEDFAHNERIFLNSIKGKEGFGSCEIKQFRLYARELHHEEVLQNHIADIKDKIKQKDKYDFNYNNKTTPVIYMYGDTENMTLENKKEMRIKYVSPNEELYGASFDIPYAKVYWQGTSSLAYVMKNYNIELYDENRVPWMYTPFNSGAKENIFCLKCDYMESSHANNVGIAQFVNDCLYDTKNPAQMKDENIRNSVMGFPIMLYINDTLEGVYNFNLDRYSVNSYGYPLFEDCLCYEISANSDSTAGAFYKWSESTGVTETAYYGSDFRSVYPQSRVGNDDFAELKRLVNWVSDADDELFKEQLEMYFNKEYLIRYYLFVLVFGAVDSLGKNMKLTTFDGLTWFPQVYDADTSLGLDNTGFLRFDTDTEIQAGNFNTSASNLWTKLWRVFYDDIVEEYAKIRQKNFNEETIMNYLYGKQISQIPELNYNKDTQRKYLDFRSTYLYACHGNRYQHMKRWLRERILYIDTLLNYNITTSDYITVRANKKGLVYLDIQTYSPMYLKVKWREEAGGTGIQTKKIGRNETARFSYELPTATDQEIIIYGGRYLKDLGDLTNLNPTALLIDKAPKLTRILCSSTKLVSVQLQNCSFLQEIDLQGCVALGTTSGGSSVLDLTQCDNLKKVNAYGTQLTSVTTNIQGGNLEEIIYPTTVQNVTMRNQVNLKKIALPVSSQQLENAYGSKKLTTVSIENSPYLESIGAIIKSKFSNIYDRNIYYPEYCDSSELEGCCLSGLVNLKLNNAWAKERFSIMKCFTLENIELYNMNSMKYLTIGSAHRASKEEYNSTGKIKKLDVQYCPSIEILELSSHYVDDCYYWTDIESENDDEGYLNCLLFADNLKMIDLDSLFPNLKQFILATTVNLEKIILPNGIKKIICEKDYRFEISPSINCIATKSAVDSMNDLGVTLNKLYGMYLSEAELTDLAMDSLVGIDSINDLNLISEHYLMKINNYRLSSSSEYPPIHTFTGTWDLRSHKGSSLKNAFQSIDFTTTNIIFPNDYEFTNIIDCSYAFSKAVLTEELEQATFNMPVLTLAPYMFSECKLSSQLPNITSKFLEDIHYMFADCVSLETVPDLNTGFVTNMEGVLRGCKLITNLPDTWEFESVEKFGGYPTYRNVYNSTGFIAGTSISRLPNKFTMQNADNIVEAFRGTLLSGEITLDIPNATEGNGLFCDCNKITKVTLLNSNNLISKLGNSESVWTNRGMFDGCVVLQEVDANLSNLISGANLFKNCHKLTSLPILSNKLELQLSGMFYGCYLLDTIPLFNTSKATIIGGENRGMFEHCHSLTTVPLFDFTNVKIADSSFADCWNLDIIELNTSNALSSCNYMFNNNERLTTVKGLNVARASELIGTFSKCKSLTTLEGFNPINATNLSQTFLKCESMVDFPTLNITKCTSLEGTFENCSSMIIAPTMETPLVKIWTNTFANCGNLTTIPKYDYSVARDMYHLFHDCIQLQTITEMDFSAPRLEWNEDIFETLIALENLTFSEAENIAEDFNVANCTLLTVQSLLNIIETLKPTVESCTLTIGEDNIDKLTIDQIAVATEKGWSIA